MVTEKDVYVFFGRTFATRGSQYQRSGAVRNVAQNLVNQTVTGNVQGKANKSYAVEVHLNYSADEIVQAKCSCPVSGPCKHAAALILDLIRQPLLLPIGQRKVAHNHPLPEAPMPAFEDNWLEELQAIASQSPDCDNSFDDDTLEQVHFFNKKKIFPVNKPIEIDGETQVVYILDTPTDNIMAVQVRRAQVLGKGFWGRSVPLHLEKLASRNQVEENDAQIGKLMLIGGASHRSAFHNFPEQKDLSKLLIELMVATGRCFWNSIIEEPLSMTDIKPVEIQWHVVEGNKQQLKFVSKCSGDKIVKAGFLWHVNELDATIGIAETDIHDAVIDKILDCPPLSPEQVEAASTSLKHLLGAGSSTIPGSVSHYSIETVIVQPKPKLRIVMEKELPSAFSSSDFLQDELMAYFGVDYGDPELNKVNTTEVKVINGTKITLMRKDRSAEEHFLTQLEKLGLYSTGRTKPGWRAQLNFRDSDVNQWFKFIQQALPSLHSHGWLIEVDQSAKLEAVVPTEWTFDTTPLGKFWLELELGVIIDGKKVALLPIIREALSHLPYLQRKKDRALNKADPMDLEDYVKRKAIGNTFHVPLEGGRFAALPADRVQAIVGAMLEVFNKKKSDGKLSAQVSLPEFLKIAQNEFIDPRDSYWSVGRETQELLNKIRAFETVSEVSPPPGFRADLRPYQIEGLSWLNFLREFELGGILADDMGLGKTVQTLAHIALEKHEGRLSKPFLVICPTSVLPNWQSEIKKFAPNLVTLALWGPGRKASYGEAIKADIVLTTYQLVRRDIAKLREHKWKAIILDEAQFIKNSSTEISKSVSVLEADYRISLTGTPVENNLGEIWSQFNFLLPGFLGEKAAFREAFRVPIESLGLEHPQIELARKIRPFLLRRTKEAVASELPEKTTIIKRVEIEGAQRDLYETVRVAMYYRVQEALANRGLAKSQLILFDAMLKLRQTCCDPRLLPIEAAQGVEESAKLQLLLEMVTQLVGEGRRILIFSQFTSMLNLIVPELNKRAISFVQIRGSTQDRATPVEQFQSGKVPVFLLSLRAGGTGLNLTAADTVIHYDPWWNPAVENQATDRAHRIGQTKPVFVFRLIAANTIEERILDLQAVKQALADGLYSSDNALPAKITQADIEQLFAPM